MTSIKWIQSFSSAWPGLQKAMMQSEYGPALFVQKKGMLGKLVNEQGVLVLYNEENIAGFAGLIKHPDLLDCPYSPFIYGLYILPACRNQGYAHMLVKQAIEKEKSFGHHHLYLASLHKNMLEEFGFSYIDELSDKQGHIHQIYAAYF
jgi:GNAT superfamily N-acetyltransferase